MMTGVDQDVDGVLMIGWHSRSKTQGVLAHTTSSFAFARVWLNQAELGEVGIYAALAGEFNVPVLMASGCNVMAEELHALMPHTDCAVVKWSDGARSGRSLSPENARLLIATTTCRSVQHLRQQQAGFPPTQSPAPFRMPGPLTLRVQCQTPAFADLFALWPTVQRTDADTVQIMCDGIQSAVRSLNALSAMSSALR
jgi:D-amino peptidase